MPLDAVIAVIAALGVAAAVPEPVTPAPAAVAPVTPGIKPIAPAMKRYGFGQALERAGKRNPTALTAEQEVLRAEAIVREVRASSLPTVIGNATGTRLDHDRATTSTIDIFDASGLRVGSRSVAGVLVQKESVTANIALSVPLLAPQRWVQWSHAADNAEVTRVSAEDIRRTLMVATARSYLAVIAQQRALEVAERGFVTAKAHYDFAHQRRQGGVGNRLDEVRAEQEVETTRATVEVTRSNLVRVQEALGIVLAEDGPVDADPRIDLGDAPPLDAALNDAASKRTDVKVLSSRLNAADHVLRDSYADYLPTVVAQGLPFYNNPATVTAPHTGWQAMLILSWPLYDGGLRYGLHDERKALVNEAQVSLEAALRQVSSDVRATYEALGHADAALDASRNAARLAGEALDLATQAYHAGATTNLEVIDAERRARDADTTAAVAEDAARQARLDLLSASGRFP